MRLFRRNMRPPPPDRNQMSREEFQRHLAVILKGYDQEGLDRITKAIGQATRVIMAKLATMEKRMSKLDELLDLVASQQTKIDSLITFTEGLRDQVKAAMGDVITPSQAMRIDQIFDAVKDNSSDIDRAMSANTDEDEADEPAPTTADPAANPAGAVTGGPSFSEIRESIDSKPSEGAGQGGQQGGTNPPS